MRTDSPPEIVPLTVSQCVYLRSHRIHVELIRKGPIIIIIVVISRNICYPSWPLTEPDRTLSKGIWGIRLNKPQLSSLSIVWSQQWVAFGPAPVCIVTYIIWLKR